MSRLVIVSNRVALPGEGAQPSGGLVTGLTVSLSPRSRELHPPRLHRLGSMPSSYLRVNALLADTLAPLLEPNDVVWVHDYHLIPMAEELRRVGAKQRIGFFLAAAIKESTLCVVARLTGNA
jgi:trehalose 6-phosphate synthase